MKNANRILWGLVLIAVGVLVILNVLGVADINIFFDGWWTLFIIVPCAIGLFTSRDKTASLIGVLIGVCLLLCCQNVLSFQLLWKLLLPALIVVAGVKLLFSGLFHNKSNVILKNMKATGRTPKNGTAVFSGHNMRFDGEVFEGAELNAIFGGIKCDLRGAAMPQDCAIAATAVFGGIDILVPPGVNVRVSSTSAFGGVSNKTAEQPNAVTLYVNATCLFGGVDIQ